MRFPSGKNAIAKISYTLQSCDFIHFSSIRHETYMNIMLENLPGGIVGGTVVGSGVVDSVKRQKNH